MKYNFKWLCVSAKDQLEAIQVAYDKTILIQQAVLKGDIAYVGNASGNWNLYSIVGVNFKGRSEKEVKRLALNKLNEVIEAIHREEYKLNKADGTNDTYKIFAVTGGERTGFHTFKAINAKIAWAHGAKKFNEEYPDRVGSLVTLYQRVLCPIITGPKARIKVNATGKNVPTHTPVAIPIYIGCSDDEFVASDDILIVNEGNILTGTNDFTELNAIKPAEEDIEDTKLNVPGYGKSSS